MKNSVYALAVIVGLGGSAFGISKKIDPSNIRAVTKVKKSKKIADPLPTPKWLTEFKLPVPGSETLPNGLILAWLEKKEVPVMDVVLLLPTGYRDDPRGESGVTQLMEATLERGNDGKTFQQTSLEVEKLGATSFVSADADSITVGMHGLSTDAEKLLDLLYRTALKPDFPPEEVEKEKEKIVDRALHLGDYAQSLAGFVFGRIIKANSPYGRGSFSKLVDIQNLDREKVALHHLKTFVPDGAIIMVSGRFDRSRIKKRIRELFGAWTGKRAKHSKASYAYSRVQPAPGQRVVLVNRAGLNQAQVKMGFKAPKIDDPDHYPLVVANAILGGYFQSRLGGRIRDDLGWSYNVGSDFGYERDLGYFVINADTRNDKVAALIKEVQSIVKSLSSRAPDAAEVKMAKEFLVGSFPLRATTSASIAVRWLAGRIFELGEGFLNEFIPKIQAVTPADVKRVATRHLTQKRMTVVVAGSASDIRPLLKSAKLWPIKQIEVKELLR